MNVFIMPKFFQNFFSTICIILLPVGESDPVQRLKMISTSVTSYIKSSLPNFLYLIGLCEGSLPIPLVRAINKNPKDDVPLVLTNVVGPPNRCFVAGEEIARIQMGQNIPLQFSSGLKLDKSMAKVIQNTL